jgi:hypothetical protein
MVLKAVVWVLMTLLTTMFPSRAASLESACTGGRGPAHRRALLFPLARASADAVSADLAGPVLLGQAQHDEAPDPDVHDAQRGPP